LCMLRQHTHTHTHSHTRTLALALTHTRTHTQVSFVNSVCTYKGGTPSTTSPRPVASGEGRQTHLRLYALHRFGGWVQGQHATTSSGHDLAEWGRSGRRCMATRCASGCSGQTTSCPAWCWSTRPSPPPPPACTPTHLHPHGVRSTKQTEAHARLPASFLGVQCAISGQQGL
jgi:hypothetical protein